MVEFCWVTILHCGLVSEYISYHYFLKHNILLTKVQMKTQAATLIANMRGNYFAGFIFTATQARHGNFVQSTQTLATLICQVRKYFTFLGQVCKFIFHLLLHRGIYFPLAANAKVPQFVMHPTRSP
jgi:hypothetical protein